MTFQTQYIPLVKLHYYINGKDCVYERGNHSLVRNVYISPLMTRRVGVGSVTSSLCGLRVSVKTSWFNIQLSTRLVLIFQRLAFFCSHYQKLKAAGGE